MRESTDEGPKLVTSDVKAQAPVGRALNGYLARPESAGPHPGVIVVQEWWGITEHIRDVARRFGREQYVALAPDLYKGVVVTEPEQARAMARSLNVAEAVQTIRDGVAYLKAQPYVKPDKIGIVGFCMGGGLLLQTLLVEDGLAAAAVFYGSPVKQEQVNRLCTPLLGLYGEEDRSIPPDATRAFQAEINRVGTPNEFHFYPKAGHAFFNDTRPTYNAEAAADAWVQTLKWFRRWLD